MREYPCRCGGVCLICGIEYRAGEMTSRLPGGRGHARCAVGALRVWSPAAVPSNRKPSSRCGAPIKGGGECSIDSGPDGPCHIHDPNGLYARQHPNYRAKLLRMIASR